jgi:ABC-2 type transport system ATP-binding protein
VEAEKIIVQAEGLTKKYGSHVAVNSLNLQIREGEIFGYLGPNGAGKTTTILMVLGLTEPTSGTIRVCGFDPARESLKVKEQVGYLPENVGFYDDMDAWQKLRYIAKLNGIPEAEARRRAEDSLALVGLVDDVGKKKVGFFSKGMRQRLGIAEVLIKNPKIIFLDEPTIGLDPDGTNKMLDLIQALRRERGMTIFLSSHLLDQVQRSCDRVGIMIKGNLVASGPIQELAEKTVGIDSSHYTLEEVYMKYFKEA